MNAIFQSHRKQPLRLILHTCGWICVLTVIFVFVSSIAVGAEPTLLWRKTFDSRIIKTSDLMDFEVGKDGKGGKFPLKTVMTEKSIYVLDGKGEIDRQIPLKDYAKVAMSDDGMTLATLKGREITISDLDEEVQGIVKIADPQPVVLPQHVSFELLPNGDYIVVISSFTHNVYFHSIEGKLVAKHHFDDLRGAEIKFSKDSHYVAMHVPNWGDGKMNGFLVYFNEAGENLWRLDHKGCQANFDISSDGSSIILAAEDKLCSLNKKGEVIYKKELVPGGIDIALSGNGKHMAITTRTDHSISLLENVNGEVRWNHNITGFDSINSPFTSLDVSNTAASIAVTISKNWTRNNKECSFYLFDKSGNILWQETFEQDRIVSALSQDRNCILLAGNKETYLYRNEQ